MRKLLGYCNNWRHRWCKKEGNNVFGENKSIPFLVLLHLHVISIVSFKNLQKLVPVLFTQPLPLISIHPINFLIGCFFFTCSLYYFYQCTFNKIPISVDKWKVDEVIDNVAFSKLVVFLALWVQWLASFCCSLRNERAGFSLSGVVTFQYLKSTLYSLIYANSF